MKRVSTSPAQRNVLSDEIDESLSIAGSDIEVGHPNNKRIHHLFEEQVAKRPGTIAVVPADQKLSEPEPHETAETNYVAPRNETEQSLARIWSDVLGIDLDTIGIEQNFFEIGGHSLAAATVAQHIRKAFNKNVTIRSIFENPTIAKLSEMVAQTDAVKHAAGPKKRTISAKDGHLPIQNRQVYSWILRLRKSVKNSNVCELFTIEGAFDIEIFQQAVKEVVRSHDSLWNVYSRKKPMTTIGKPANPRIELIDISAAGPEDQGRLFHEALNTVFHAPFDIFTAPLFRMALIKKENAGYFLLISLPHVISDYASINALIKEIFDRYGQIAQGMPPRSLKKSSTIDIVNSERAYLQGDEFKEDADFWKKQLEDSELLKFDKEFFLPKAASTDQKLLAKIHINKQAINGLKKIALETNASLQMIFLALVKATLCTFSGQNEILINLIMDARGLHANPPVMNLNVASIVVRSDLLMTPAYIDLLLHIKQSMIDAHGHMRYPFTNALPAILFLKRKPLTAFFSRLAGEIWSLRFRRAGINSQFLTSLTSFYWAMRAIAKKVRKEKKNMQLAPAVVYNVIPNFYENPIVYEMDGLSVVNLRERELIMNREVFVDNSEFHDAQSLNIDLIRDKDDEVFLYLFGGRLNGNAFSRMQEIFKRHLDQMLKNPAGRIS